MTDQNPPPSPYEPPGSSGSGDTGDTGSTGASGSTGGYEPPSTGSGYQPASGGGSVYESSSYQSAGGQIPPPPPPYQATTGPVAPGARNNTQLFGILGIVFAVVCCPLLGVLFGWLSMNEAKKTGSDDTLGKVGFWLGIAMTAVGLIAAIIAVCAGAFSSNNMNY